MKRDNQKCALLGGQPARNRAFANHPVMGKEEKKEVLSVLETGLLSGFLGTPGKFFLGGPKVRGLEELFCSAFNIKHAVAMNSATSALHAALLAIGIEPGDEVLVSPYTMSASATAILMCGGIPVFVDIESETYGIDPAKIEERMSPKTKAIVVVHLFGHPAQMKSILKIARKHGLKVVEDSAQSPGARFEDSFAGTVGDVGIFSLNQHKTITSGEGGVAVTPDDEIALKMQLIRNHGEVVSDHMEEAKDIRCLGWNYRMTELEAAVALAQFKKIDFLTDHRIELAHYLNTKLEKFEGLNLPVTKNRCKHVYFVYPIHYEAKKVGLSRALFLKALAAEGVPFGGGYVRPIYYEPIYRDRKIYQKSAFPFDLQSGKNLKNYLKGSCPTTEYYYHEGLILTGLCRYPLTMTDMDDIVHAFEKIFSSVSELQSQE